MVKLSKTVRMAKYAALQRRIDLLRKEAEVGLFWQGMANLARNLWHKALKPLWMRIRTSKPFLTLKNWWTMPPAPSTTSTQKKQSPSKTVFFE